MSRKWSRRARRPRPRPEKGPDKNITLTPETVVVDGDGGKALKAFGPDGRSLVLDAGAKGADQLAPGKILLLTGVMVVRVASLTRNGDTLEIVGGPRTRCRSKVGVPSRS